MINQKPSNIKGFSDSKPENSNFMPFGPKPPALPTAPHPEIDMKFNFEVANMWCEPLFRGFCESRKIEFSLEYQGFQRLPKKSNG